MFAEERKDKIIEILQIKNRITVIELTETLGVSEATIRRDLQELETNGFLKRSHGGAILNLPNNFEPSYIEKEVSFIQEKKYIASIAADFIKDGDIIIIDSGTTTIQMIPFIQNKNITVVTNSISLSYMLTSFKNIELILTGGQNRSLTKSLVGNFANETLKNIRANKAFMATNGFEFDFGFSTPNIEEAKTKKSMMKSSDEIFILADNSKFNKSSMVKFASLDEIDFIITDSNLSQKIIDKIIETGVKIKN